MDGPDIQKKSKRSMPLLPELFQKETSTCTSNELKIIRGVRVTKTVVNNRLAPQSTDEEMTKERKSICFNPFKIIDREMRLKREIWDAYRHFFYLGRF